MNREIKKQKRFWGGKKFGIKSSLKLLGVDYSKEARRRFRSPEGGLVEGLANTPLSFQWGLFEKARTNFRTGVKEHHTDKGGNVEQYRNTVMAWKYARGWFAKAGIE